VTDAEPRWLNCDEEEAWKAMVGLFLRLPSSLDSQLQRDAGISMFDYLVLSALSMAENRTLRMSELAKLTNASLSRLSNVVSRHEQRGWVRRCADPTDGRYIHATLTDDGWDLVVRAAPGHVARVREIVLDPLSPAQIREMEAIGKRILQEIEAASSRSSRT
jgi:DNA-binding MarR family transcriptional regulator